jgi:glycosyltransferase involved in cell wall biosynthesis
MKSHTNGKPRATVLYHYFHPDDVVSARHFDEFCAGLVTRNWQVEVLPSNRSCHDGRSAYPLKQEWRGISIRRVWRPPLRQSSNFGRVINAAWMILSWSAILVTRRKDRLPSILVVGTDPILSVLVAWLVKKLRPGIRIAHWCYDLYPEAPIAEGMVREDSVVVQIIRRMTRAAYRSCDLLADLGCCMRRLLDRYGTRTRQVTLVPWALSEPENGALPNPAVRESLFGDAALGLLYSGNLGRAHSYEEFLELARGLRHHQVSLCFGVRGNQVEQLRRAIGPGDANIRFAGFAPEADLALRLKAADVHLVSLRQGWTGVVVPSKFFGSLASGRPVIFAGSRDSAIARWIEEYQVGWVLDRNSLASVANELQLLAASKDELEALQRHCHAVYHAHFSYRRIMDRWDQELRALMVS